MSQFRLDNIIAHYQKHRLSTRIHGNVKCLPSNSIPFEEVKRVSTFIENFARANGMPLPGRVPNHPDKVMILPADVAKQFIYDKYCDMSTTSGGVVVGHSKFYGIWHHNLPHISISKPSSDLCYTCQSNAMALQKSIALSEEKAKLLEMAQRHFT